jgi:hypothetical protein
MTIQRVARFVPPAACQHEATMVNGQWVCVICGAYVPPTMPNEPEWVRRAHAHTLPTKDMSGLSMAPGEWQEMYGR